MADLIYQADLDDKKVLQALQRIDKNIDRIASDADKHFQGIGKSAGVSGVQIGAISGVVQEVTRRFIDLGIQALKAFADIAAESTQIALGFDVLKSRLLGIFDGNKEAAGEAFGFIQKKSKELGIDLGEVAGAFLPKVESLEQFERVAKIATALARSDPEQGAIGARIALIEALSGTFTSLQRRFEIPKDDIKAIKEAFDTGGMDGFIAKLEEVLDKSGKSFDDLKNTAQASIDRVKIQFEQLKGALGIPIVEELKEQFDTLFAVLEGREDDLLLIADTFGRVAANIVEIIGTGLTDFLTNLDSEQVIHLGETFFEITEDVGVLIDLLAGVDFPSSFIEGVDAAATKLKELLETTAKLVAMAQANAAREAAEAEALAGMGLPARSGGVPTELLLSGEKQAEIAAAGQAAYNKVLTEAVGKMQEATQASEDNAAATDKRREAIEKAKDTSTADADALLGEAAAARDAAEAAEVLAGAQAKVNEALADAKQDFDRKLEDIDIAAERKRLDIQIEFAQKREDAARNNLQKLADIRLKNNQDIDDAATDLERKEEDIARKFADERIDLERDQRQSRLDIETSFRQKLEDIQKQSAFDLEEAERNRDAIGFLRILRQQQQQVSTAQTDRQRELDELRVNGELKKEELRIQQQREIEEAHITNERKLEDLRLNLDRQIEAQNTAYAQQIEDIAINEARKNEEAAKARERDIEDAKLAYDRKLADLQVSLAEELAIIAAGNVAIEAEAKRHADEMAAIAAQERASAPVRDTGRPSSRPGAQNIQQQYAAQPASRPGAVNQGRAPSTGSGRSFGGLVNRGQAVPVGESGPELFTPNANGKIIPSNQLLMPSFQPKSAISNITNNNQKSANLGGLLDANSLDTLLASKVQNILLQMLDRMG